MLSNFSRGLWSGLAATGPMTLLMFSLFRESPKSEKKDLVLAVHFGYGILMAITYATLARKFKFKSPILQGASYGLTIWGASYMGLAPLFGLRATSVEMIAKRNAVMTATHIVWGAYLAMIESHLRKNNPDSAL